MSHIFLDSSLRSKSRRYFYSYYISRHLSIISHINHHFHQLIALLSLQLYRTIHSLYDCNHINHTPYNWLKCFFNWAEIVHILWDILIFLNFLNQRVRVEVNAVVILNTRVSLICYPKSTASHFINASLFNNRVKFLSRLVKETPLDLGTAFVDQLHIKKHSSFLPIVRPELLPCHHSCLDHPLIHECVQ